MNGNGNTRMGGPIKLFQYRTFIGCKIPIYKDRPTGVLSKPSISFSRDYSRFTLLFEAEGMRLMRIHDCFTSVAKTLHIRPQRVESIYHHYTQDLEDDYIEAPRQYRLWRNFN
jgi:hypothetical protein